MVTFFIFVKTNFPVPINCLNGQSGLVMTKIYQTEANKPLIYSNHTGVRPRTPCISFTFFIRVKKQLSCTYQLSKLSKWTYYVQNVPNRCQRTLKYTGVRARTPAYELVRRAFFSHFSFSSKTAFLCLLTVYIAKVDLL